MPKKIFSQFNGGISLKDKDIPDNQFFIGDKIDLFRNDGYLTPSPTFTDSWNAGASSSTFLRATPISCVMDTISSKAYLLATNGDLYQISDLGGTFNANFDGSNHYYRAIGSFSTTNGGAGINDMIFYDVSGTRKLFYSYNTASQAYIGTYDLSSTFSDTAINLGTDATSIIAPHPMVEWNTVLWIGNGRYLAKYVGSTNTITATKLDLGVGWQITSLFTTNNYIGICAWKKGVSGSLTECRVFFWDGDSSTIAYSIEANDNQIFSSINYNGRVYLSMGNRNSWSQIGVLTDNGIQTIKKLYLTINGTYNTLGGSKIGTMSVCQNRLFIGETYRWSSILSIGSETDSNEVFTIPYILSANSGDFIGCVKHIATTSLGVGWKDTANTKYYFYLINPISTSYGTATYKAGYTDFGQRVKINYVKVYFKTLVSGDSLTVGLDTDYGTSKTLGIGTGNVSYAKDGAVTSKVFKNLGFQCHAFRPTIVWATGGTAISKIVVDYSFISD